MHRKITQCKLHAGMQPYVDNKYFNWFALSVIQLYTTTQVRALKGTKDIIRSGNIIFNIF